MSRRRPSETRPPRTPGRIRPAWPRCHATDSRRSGIGRSTARPTGRRTPSSQSRGRIRRCGEACLGASCCSGPRPCSAWNLTALCLPLPAQKWPGSRQGADLAMISRPGAPGWIATSEPSPSPGRSATPCGPGRPRVDSPRCTDSALQAVVLPDNARRRSMTPDDGRRIHHDWIFRNVVPISHGDVFRALGLERRGPRRVRLAAEKDDWAGAYVDAESNRREGPARIIGLRTETRG